MQKRVDIKVIWCYNASINKKGGTDMSKETKKNQGRGNFYLVGLLALVLILLVLFFVTGDRSGQKALYLSDVLTEGTLEREHFVDTVEAVLGTDYLTYTDELSQAFDKNDLEEVLFPMEGAEAYVVFHNKPQVKDIKSVSFVLEGDLDEQGWYDLTQQVTESLTTRAKGVENSSHFYFPGGEIWLDFGPVDQSEIQVHEDGTSSYAGVIGAMGTRIETIWVEFD